MLWVFGSCGRGVGGSASGRRLSFSGSRGGVTGGLFLFCLEILVVLADSGSSDGLGLFTLGGRGGGFYRGSLGSRFSHG